MGPIRAIIHREKRTLPFEKKQKQVDVKPRAADFFFSDDDIDCLHPTPGK